MLFQYCCRSLFVSLLQDMPANAVTFYLLCNALPDASHLSCVPTDTEGTVWFKWRQEKPEYCPFKEIPTVQITSLLLHCVMPTKTQNIQHEEDLASNEGVFSCVSSVTHCISSHQVEQRSQAPVSITVHTDTQFLLKLLRVPVIASKTW